jgi:hypothetical protein
MLLGKNPARRVPARFILRREDMEDMSYEMDEEEEEEVEEHRQHEDR